MTSSGVRPLATALVIAQVLVSAANGATPARPDAKPTIETVIRAWEQRQKQVQSFRFSWEATQWYDGAFIPGAQAGILGAFPQDVADSASYKSRVTLVMDAQGRTRMERLDASWHAGLKKLVPVTSINVCDGGIHRSFSPEGPTNVPEGVGLMPCGSIDRFMLSRRTTDLLPIRLVFRPFDESVGPFDRKNLVLTEGQGVADGFPCVAVRQDDQIFWVDPKRSFIPLRVYRMARVVAPERIGFGEIIFRLAVQYSEDKEFGWIPAAWSIESNHSSTGNLISSTTARVAAYKINSPIPEATFELPFPPGTWVHDRVKNENYILREGGKHRPVLPGEYNGRNYEQIRDSEPPVRP